MNREYLQEHAIGPVEPAAEPKEEPREDGLCCRCQKRRAETRDKLLCSPCLKKVVREELTPIVRSGPREQVGRSQRSSKVLGGSAIREENEDG